MCNCCSSKTAMITVAIVTVLLALFKGQITRTLHTHLEVQVVEGVHAPHSVSVFDTVKHIWNINPETVLKVGDFILNNQVDITGADKSESNEEFRKIQQYAVDNVLRLREHDVSPVDGYLWFGNKNWQKILSLFAKENPFCAVFLTGGEDAGEPFLELKAYDENDFERKLDSYYSRFLQHESGAGHYINIRFNTDMEITSVTYYDEVAKKSVAAPKKDWDRWATGALYNLFMFGEAFHATIHVFHYILTSAMRYSTEHDTSQSTWARPFNREISVKYLEVAATLLKGTYGSISGRVLEMPDDAYVITSNHALTPKCQVPLKEMFSIWCSCLTAEEFMEKFLLKDLYKSANGKELAKKAGILKEFGKMVDYIGPFAKDVSDGIKKDDESAFRTTEKGFREFLADTGDVPIAIDSIAAFVELMSITGIVHGSTLSFTRLIVNPEVLRWKNIENKKWDGKDSGILSMAIGTMAGTTEGRHVFMNDIHNGEKIAKNLRKALDKHANKAEKLKEKNKQKLLEDPEYLRQYGWILTDWCPDGFDGKQMTIATYI